MCHELASRRVVWYLRDVRRFLFSLIGLAGLAQAGCGPHCDRAHVCAVDGRPPNVEVCDGDEFRTCGNGNRGAQIDCGEAPRRAVCTLDGWTFENAEGGDGK